MLVIVGLGNPGAAYRNTRHNAGYMLVDGIADGSLIPDAVIHRSASKVLTRLFTSKTVFQKTSGPYVKVEGDLYGKRFLLVKPTTFMNESGRAVSFLTRKAILKDLDELLVIVDDINLETGLIRLRDKGSDGGQKGLRSIINNLGSDQFCRLRIGIGPKPPGEELSDYVLKSFKPDERVIINKTLIDGASVVSSWIDGGYEAAQREFSRISL